MATSFDRDRSAYQPAHNQYSQPTNNTFSQNPTNTFSQSTGSNYTQSTGNNFSQNPNNNYSQSAGNNYSPSTNNNPIQTTTNTLAQPPNNPLPHPTNNNFSQSTGAYSQPTGNTSLQNPNTSYPQSQSVGNIQPQSGNNAFSQTPGHSYPQPPQSIDTTAGAGLRGPNTGGSGPVDDLTRRLDIALHCDQGVEKLQNRLRQSIYSARDFSNVLRERCALEDRYAQGFKKLVRNAAESVRRPEARQGSFLHSFDETLRINDRIADNTLLFANNLHTMSEELRDMADNADKGRKQWKHHTTDAERRLADAENALQKARDRYNAAAEQYDRVRSGERPAGKFGLKNKSPAQQEEALKEKADMLDQEYNQRREAAQAQRYEFENSTRPQIVHALRELIDESDAHLAMQLAKLASLSEKHVVSNGVAISPIKSTTSTTGPEPRGLRQLAQEIDNKKDFNDYILDGRENTMPFGARTSRQGEPGQNFGPNQPGQTTGFVAGGMQQNPNVSGAPQLPQISGSDEFSRSFDTARPTDTNTNRLSYAGDQPLNTVIASTTHPQQSLQSPYSPDSRPPIESNPSLPAFDRGLPPANGSSSVPTVADKRMASGTTGPTHTNGRDLATAAIIPGVYTGRGSGTPAGAPVVGPTTGMGQDAGRGRGMSNPTTIAGVGRGQQPYGNDRMQGVTGPDAGYGRDQQTSVGAAGLPTPNTGYGRGSALSPTDRQQGMPISNTGYGRGQQPLNDRTQGLPMPNTEYGRGPNATGPIQQSGLGRGQTSTYNDPNTNLRGSDVAIGRGQSGINTNQPSNFGRGQQSPYNNRTQGMGTTSDMAMGRGQSPTGPIQQTGMGRGQPSPYNGRGQGALAGGALAGSALAAGAMGSNAMGRGQTPGGRAGPGQQLSQQPKPSLPPLKPVFGVHLDELFRRDGTAVPVIVFQCIQAVDIHGINTEGIYRISGSAQTVAQLKNEFDHDYSLVNLKMSQTYNNDIASVAILLKNFLRDLPDPLLTAPAYQSFIQAAKYDDLVMRRDALHQYINSLPDPNYATLRVLVLHLHRISRNSEVNKMDIKNLSIVFGPTVLGGDVSDAGLQTKVMETILHHTFEIFDPDE